METEVSLPSLQLFLPLLHPNVFYLVCSSCLTGSRSDFYFLRTSYKEMLKWEVYSCRSRFVRVIFSRSFADILIIWCHTLSSNGSVPNTKNKQKKKELGIDIYYELDKYITPLHTVCLRYNLVMSCYLKTVSSHRFLPFEFFDSEICVRGNKPIII